MVYFLWNQFDEKVNILQCLIDWFDQAIEYFDIFFLEAFEVKIFIDAYVVTTEMTGSTPNLRFILHFSEFWEKIH